MFDFIYLFIVPVIITVALAFGIAIINNGLAKRKSKKVKIRNISTQSRNIHDSNHKRSKIERLMIPRSDADFIKDWNLLIKHNMDNN